MSSEHAFGLLRILERDGFVIYPTKGVSMYPLLREGKTLVRLEALSGAPSVYDVVLFKRRNALVLHRIVAAGKDYFFISGDNTRSFEKVRRDAVKAVMKGYFREDGEYVAADSAENSLFTLTRWKGFCDRPFFTEETVRANIESGDLSDYQSFLDRGAEAPEALPSNKEALRLIRRFKRKAFLRRVFPEFKKLKQEYPVLEKAPALLPFVWAARCFKKLTKRPGHKI